jgi:hypothetical protein
MNYNLSIIHYSEEINKKIDTFKGLIESVDETKRDKYGNIIQDTLIWKKSRIVSLMVALDREVEDLNKYTVEGEDEEDKKNNNLTNKIYSTIMPLMTYVWFLNQVPIDTDNQDNMLTFND